MLRVPTLTMLLIGCESMKDYHLCPLCKCKQINLLDTWVCKHCDADVIEDLKVAKLWKEIYEMENE